MKTISNLDLNIVKEKIYVEGLINKLYDDILHYGEGEVDAKFLMESIIKEEKGKNIIQDIVDEFKLAPKFIFTFGTGIGAFYDPVQKLLEGSGFVIGEKEVYLIIITAIASILNDRKVGKLIERLKSEGLYPVLEDVKRYINSTRRIINSVTKNVLGSTYTLTDILGFTALLVPAMNLLNTIISDYGLNMGNLENMLKGVVLSASVYGIKSIIKRLRNKLS